jgi:hypothetical protein
MSHLAVARPRPISSDGLAWRRGKGRIRPGPSALGLLPQTALSRIATRPPGPG